MTDHCFKPVRARTMTYSFTLYLSKVTRSKVKVKVTGSLVVMCDCVRPVACRFTLSLSSLSSSSSSSSLLWWRVCLKVIESIRLDGSDRRLLLTKVGHAYGVAVVEGVVYWTDWQTESVWRANVTDTSVSATSVSPQRQLVVDKLAGLMDLHAASVTTHHATQRESVFTPLCNDVFTLHTLLNYQ